MANKEYLVMRVYEIVNELKIPLIDERLYDRYNLDEKRYPCTIIFKYEEDESVIRGFLGLAEYFHTVIIKNKSDFDLVHGGTLFKLVT